MIGAPFHVKMIKRLRGNCNLEEGDINANFAAFQRIRFTGPSKKVGPSLRDIASWLLQRFTQPRYHFFAGALYIHMERTE